MAAGSVGNGTPAAPVASCLEAGSRATPAEGKLALGAPACYPRSVFRAWTGLVLATATASGCGTDAVGTAECRTLERARCEAAAACGYPNVDECIRYQRDHCLHGTAVETISGVELDACAEDVARAGRCAAGQGPDTRASSCSEAVTTAPATATACDVVRSPERAASCAFLLPAGAAPPPPAPAPMTADGGA